MKVEYYKLNDIGTIAKMEEGVPFLYFRGEGWKPDNILSEYLYLGEGDCEAITDIEAERLISQLDRGARISG